jgi:general secretion pathway protein I
MTRRREAGFTLVEVLVALAVVAFAIAALMRGLGQGIRVGTALPERLQARWVAENRLALHQIRGDWPDADTYDGSTRMGGREWFWVEEVRETPQQGLRRIAVRVGTGEDDPRLVTLDGFVTRIPEQGIAAGGGDGGQ